MTRPPTDADAPDGEFVGELWYWRGPAPWYFVTPPEEQCLDLRAAATFVSYGWGMIPVRVRVGEDEWETSLFPKDGRYVVPVKADVRKAEYLEDGDSVTIRLSIRHEALPRMHVRRPRRVPLNRHDPG